MIEFNCRGAINTGERLIEDNHTRLKIEDFSENNDYFKTLYVTAHNKEDTEPTEFKFLLEQNAWANFRKTLYTLKIGVYTGEYTGISIIATMDRGRVRMVITRGSQFLNLLIKKADAHRLGMVK